ncbi:pyridoxal phosphate-dependent aminotransferase [Romboutsia weinsteinii]|uniref:cysteine-S-conjugate beta-lyase n=1 Tax=Romboutsia weinsteinii TaxID=2020949 RepID=A0A371IXV9_9FIRM|nr:MalY/PatB family protein [Romboutsia weinsteinii]RDY25325.1 pyridoxal phosphate-dependent aminotransferase [Romboutsia weinsteinii]
MKYNFDKVINRKESNCRKWSNHVLKEKFDLDETAIPMDLADIDFECAPAIKEAIMKRASVGDYSYTFISDEFYESVINWNKRRFNVDIEKEWIKLTFGTVSTLHYIVQAYTKIGEGVLINTPAYDPFAEAIENNNRKLYCSPLKLEDNRYYLDFKDIESQMKTGNIKVYIFCSPQNPSGRVWTKDELYQLSELCLKYNVLLVSDEIHRDVVFKGDKFISLWNAHPEIQRTSIICVSPNKGFNLGGLKTSYVLAQNKEVREILLEQLKSNSITSPNVFAIPAITAAYDHGEEWLDEMGEYVYGNFEIVYDFFRNNIPEAKVMESDSSFLAWIDVRGLFKNEDEAKSFFKAANVTMVVGSYFVQDGEGFIRLNIGCPRNTLNEALNRIKHTYETLYCK